MPMKTAERKLIFPAVCIILALSALACLPALGKGERQFAISHGGEVCLPLGEGFAALNGSGMSIYSREGELLFNEERAFAPHLSASEGDRLLLASEDEARLYDGNGFLGTLEGDGEILALAVFGDYAAVSRKDSYYKSTVTFYEDLDPLFTRCLAKGECRQLLMTDDFACLLTDSEMLLLRSPEDVSLIPVDAGVRLHRAYDGVCLQRETSLDFYSAKGEKTGSFEGEFTLVGAFGDVLCAVTDEGTAIIDSRGKIRQLAPYKPLKFGTGDSIALIMGEETFIFDEKMELIYSFENKYIPLNVITDKNAVMHFWQRAAQVHRK